MEVNTFMCWILEECHILCFPLCHSVILGVVDHHDQTLAMLCNRNFCKFLYIFACSDVYNIISNLSSISK